MELRLKRIARKETYTIGRLYVDGKYVCDTIEDRDRGLSQSLPVSVNIAKKRKGMTAIPTGRYRVTLDVKSPRFSKFKSYAWCDGYLPRLINVPAFDGILIHAGNTAANTDGCLLVGENKVGENKVVGKVLNSMDTLKRLYEILKSAKDSIYITVE